MLKVEQFMDIKLLSRQGHSIREIARRSGHARNTVRRMLRAETTPAFSTPERASPLAPFKPYLTKRFDEHGLSAVRLHAEVAAQGYAGSVHTVRRFLATLRPLRQAAAKATLRFETAPGEQAQADWAHCGKHIDASGREIRVYAFVMVLSFSRMTFVCFTRSMGVEALVECHRLAFERFGGVPAKILYDNTKEVWLDPATLNPAFADFAAHHGFTPTRCRAYRPRTKGKVERTIQYVEGSFLRGSVFADLDDLNAQAAAWADRVANVRVHATTGERPIDLFARERETLASVSALKPYRFIARESRTVGSESTVRFHGSRYSVPPRLVGTRVDVSGEAGRVTVRCGDVIVAEHDWAKPGACVMRPEDVSELWKISRATSTVPPPTWRLTGGHEVESPSLEIYGRIGMAERSMSTRGPVAVALEVAS
jgi:transposase